ncbi:MAG TPA: hypothetical protein VGR70_08725 [Stellaceae bacterium]|nr:hypothetical protein [Stellaceae bacterium]
MLRIPPALDQKVAKSAALNTTSKSEEIERRLAASFDREDLIEQVLAQTRGAKGADLALTLIEAMRRQRILVGVRELGVTLLVREPDAVWQDRPSYDHLREALIEIIDRFRPVGPHPDRAPPKLGEIVGPDDEDFKRIRDAPLHTVLANTAVQQRRTKGSKQ